MFWRRGQCFFDLSASPQLNLCERVVDEEEGKNEPGSALLSGSESCSCAILRLRPRPICSNGCNSCFISCLDLKGSESSEADSTVSCPGERARASRSRTNSGPAACHSAVGRDKAGDAARKRSPLGPGQRRPGRGFRFLSRPAHDSSAEPAAGARGRAPTISSGCPHERLGELSQMAHAGANRRAVRSGGRGHSNRGWLAQFAWVSGCEDFKKQAADRVFRHRRPVARGLPHSDSPVQRQRRNALRQLD